jgi:predicted acetyltransferase
MSEKDELFETELLMKSYNLSLDFKILNLQKKVSLFHEIWFDGLRRNTYFMGGIPMSFQFLSFDLLTGEDLNLQIDEKVPSDEEKGWVPAYKYHMILPGTQTVVGVIDLRIGYQESLYYGGNIGYTVYEDYRGHHFAGKACLLLKQVAIAHNMKKLIITCNPENIPSRKTCEYVGAQFIEIVDLPPYNDMYQRGERQVCIYQWDY